MGWAKGSAPFLYFCKIIGMENDNTLRKVALNSLSAETEIFEEDYAGHSIKYKLLNAKEDLYATLLCKEWEKSEEFETARMTATFALSVVSVDGVAFYTPISNDFKKTCNDRWAIALTYYLPVIVNWYENYIDHMVEMAEAFKELKKK